MTMVGRTIRLVVFGAALAAPARGEGPLFNGPRIPLGGDPAGLAMGDLDGDGRPDLVACVRDEQAVVVVLQPGGDPEFLPALVVGGDPSAVDLADVDGDGWLDVLVAREASHDVFVLRGLGHGGLVAGGAFPVDLGPVRLTHGDWTGDGHLDVAVAALAAGRVSLLPGLGDGTFAPFMSVAACAGPTRLVSRDLDADGQLDLAILCSQDEELRVLLGDGAGGLAPGGSTPLTTGPVDMALADVDLDGADDLLVLGCQFATLQRGLGDGSFGAMTLLGGNPGLCEPDPLVGVLEVEDWSADGIPDLAVTTLFGPSLNLLRGRGDGTFDNWVASDLGGAGTESSPKASDAVTGDLDGDGRVELVLLNPVADDATVWHVAPSGDLGATRTFVGSAPGALATGDLDNDGALDAVLGGSYAGTPRLSVLRGDGAGDFTLAFEGAPWTHIFDVETGDLDGDGRLDVILAEDSELPVSGVFPGVGLWMGVGDGTLVAGTALDTTHQERDVEVADLDLDGDLDLIVQTNQSVYAGLGDGSGAFQLVDMQLSPTWLTHAAVAVGDLGGDGVPDLVTLGLLVPMVHVWPGDGAGGVQAGQAHTLSVQELRDVEIVDVQGDGLPDVAIAADTQVVVLPGLGGGALGPALSAELGLVPSALAVGDLDDDGRGDLVLGGPNPDRPAVCLVRWAGGQLDVGAVVAGTQVNDVAFADLDGVGGPELLLAQHNGVFDELAALRNGPTVPWCGVFGGTPGEAGSAPVLRLAGEGDLAPGGVVSLSLTGLPGSGSAWLVLGVAALEIPWNGGVLVPRPDVIVPVQADALGAWHHVVDVPVDVPSAAALWWQAWAPSVRGGLHGSHALNTVTL